MHPEPVHHRLALASEPVGVAIKYMSPAASLRKRAYAVAPTLFCTRTPRPVLVVRSRLAAELIKLPPVTVTEPGATKVKGIESVTAPVEAEAVIWLAVPAIEVTPVPPTGLQEPE